MKKILSIILALIITAALASCSKAEPEKAATEATEAEVKTDYVISEDAAPESVINGVMTDISSKDPILKRETASWLDTCVLYEVNIRQFTEEGTFAAFEKHLDRLKSMGVNTLWLMPIHPISEEERKGTLGSYYAVKDYMDVNPEFGTMDDFKHLLGKAHDMGFKVILDWVANHTGRDNNWIEEHPDWFARTKSGEIESPYDWTDTAQLDYENYEMRAEMIKCMQFWVEDIGVDGFRCDHAIGVPATFWNAAVYKLKSINSEIMMLAETSAAPSLTAYAFDCCYNDLLYGQACMVRGGVGTSTISQGIVVSDKYSEGSFPMNYLDNHDKNSYEGTIVEKFADAYPALLALTFMSPGLPLIYTSNEQGYDHEIEFFEKDTGKWDEEPKYADLIAALSAVKAGNKALASTNRDVEFTEADNSNCFVFTRKSGDNTVIYVGNLLYEKISDVSFDLGAENVTCVMSYDGTKLNTEPSSMTTSDFEHRDYVPYEFYILTVG